MSRALLPGSVLNEIAGSLQRYPAFEVLAWNPHTVTINDVAAGTVADVAVDLTPFIESIDYQENIGFESGDDPSTPSAAFAFKRNPNAGVNLRRGLIEDGVIVQIRQGDRRVAREDWIPIFTGTFRGRPGDNPGSRDDRGEGFTATAHGREERYLNLKVTTDSYPAGTDAGALAVAIAQKHMGLGQAEILLGDQGFPLLHNTNQVVEEAALTALWHCLFPVGKKPKFDAQGRLVAADIRLDKPAIRIYGAGDALIVSNVAAPNDVEVNNSVVVRGLDAMLTRVVQEAKLITPLTVVTGFFDREYDEPVYYSEDRTQRAQDTYLVTRKGIRWSSGSWTEVDEFHGNLEIDTRYLSNARAIIFASYLAIQIARAVIELALDEGGEFIFFIGQMEGRDLKADKFAFDVASTATLAALLWSMQYIGRGEYEVWGRPYENAYRELVARHQLDGLEPEEVREAELRNDFIATMADLDAAAAERLRRELVKNQVHQIEVLDDPLLEVDDIVQTADGSRYYVTSIRKRIQREGRPTLTLTAWKIYDGALAAIDALEIHEAA